MSQGAAMRATEQRAVDAYYEAIKRADGEGLAPEMWDDYALTAVWNAALSSPTARTEDDREALERVLAETKLIDATGGHHFLRRSEFEQLALAADKAGFRRSPAAPSEDVAKLVEATQRLDALVNGSIPYTLTYNWRDDLALVLAALRSGAAVLVETEPSAEAVERTAIALFMGDSGYARELWDEHLQEYNREFWRDQARLAHKTLFRPDREEQR